MRARPGEGAGERARLVVFLVAGVESPPSASGRTTGISGERTVAVEVADDGEQPYLGVTVHSPRLPTGRHEGVPVLTLRHHLEHESTLRVTATVSGVERSTPPDVGIESRSLVLGTGEEGTLAASVVCAGGRDGTVTVGVSVEGGAVLDRVRPRRRPRVCRRTGGKHVSGRGTPNGVRR